MCNKKTYFLLLAFCLFTMYRGFAQDQKVADSLKIIYQRDTAEGISKYNLLIDLSFNEVRDLKQGVRYAEELISLSRQAGDDKYLSAGYFWKGTKERLLGNLDTALNALFKSAEIAKRSHLSKSEGNAYEEVANIYSVAKNHQTAMLYYNKAITAMRQSNDSNSLASALANAGDEFLNIKKYDSAFSYLNEAKIIFDNLNYLTGKVYCLGNLGVVYANLGNNDLAEKNINDAIRILEESQDYYPICDYLLPMAEVYSDKGDMQTALNYALRSLSLADKYKLKEQIANANLKVSELYEKMGNLGEALKHYKNYIAYRDSLSNIKSVQAMYNLQSRFDNSQHQAQVKLLNQQERNQRNLLISLMIIFGLTVITLGIILRNNKSKQKAYKILDKQKQETDKEKAKAEDALRELQATQMQLMHRERMASLGELTAGIAHEIQNPLNFVNNFSDVNAELLDELQQELKKGNVGEALSISNGIIENEQKINHHGKRADAIVKGMMQHSRSSTGHTEPTDINALASEYLKLSYHGLRAKDKSFNATMDTHFDENLPKVNIVPQDIGRVLLNLCNNAFYSVTEKKKDPQPLKGSEEYEPKVTVTTKALKPPLGGLGVEISVKDNGTGIPQKITDKIFNPFFTTKPAGQGTGLGLSLSYDIVKAHGGTITINTREGEFAEFIIRIPANT
ncbi:MAG: ATP-binding protein [Ginsengibacter sp.]